MGEQAIKEKKCVHIWEETGEMDKREVNIFKNKRKRHGTQTLLHRKFICKKCKKSKFFPIEDIIIRW